MLRLTDILASAWGLTEAADVVTLRATKTGSPPLLMIHGETYDASDPDRIYGQTLPALGEEDAARPGERLILAGLRQDGGFRSVIWLFNPSRESVLATLVYRRGDGSEAGRMEDFWVPPGRIRQIGPFQHPLPAGGLGIFTVEVFPQGGRLLGAPRW